MALEFQKRLQVANPRLSMLYYFLNLLMVFALLLKFLAGHEYIKGLKLSSEIQVQLYAQGHTETQTLNKLWKQHNSSQLCTSPETYDYAWDPARFWEYVGHICPPLCSVKRTRGCLRPEELFQRPSNSEVFLVTQRQQKIFSSINYTLERTINEFVPTVDALQVGMVYGVEVHNRDVFGYKKERMLGSSSKNANTDIIDSRGNVWKSVKPGDPIELTVKELLFLAGADGALDEPHVNAGKNVLPNATLKSGPIGRISGLNLVMDVQCYNYDRDNWLPTWPQSEPSCSLSVQLSALGWSSKDRVDVVSETGGRRHFSQHGIYIIVRRGGEYRFVNLNEILLALTTMIVFMDLPRQFVCYIAEQWLGSLSKVYRHAVIEYFNIQEQIAGFVMRMMVFDEVFCELEDVFTGSANNKRGISKGRIFEKLREVLRYHPDKVTDEDVTILGDFCFESVASCTLRSSGKRSERKEIAREVDSISQGRSTQRKSKVATHTRITNIDLGAFSAATSSNECVELLTVLELFKEAKRRSCFECVLTPSYLKEYMDTQLHRSSSETQEVRTLSSEDRPAPQILPSPKCSNVHEQAVQAMHTDVEQMQEQTQVIGTSSLTTLTDLERKPTELARLVEDAVREFKCQEELALENRKHLADRLDTVELCMSRWEERAAAVELFMSRWTQTTTDERQDQGSSSWPWICTSHAALSIGCPTSFENSSAIGHMVQNVEHVGGESDTQLEMVHNGPVCTNQT